MSYSRQRHKRASVLRVFLSFYGRVADLDAAEQFGEIVEEVPLSDEAAAKQLAAIDGERDWRDKLERLEKEMAEPEVKTDA